MRCVLLGSIVVAIGGLAGCGDDSSDDAGDAGLAFDGGGARDATVGRDAAAERDAALPDWVLCGACAPPLTIVAIVEDEAALSVPWSAHVTGDGVDCTVTNTSRECAFSLDPGDYHVDVVVDGEPRDALDITIEPTNAQLGAYCDCGYLPVTIEIELRLSEQCDGDGGVDEDASPC